MRTLWKLIFCADFGPQTVQKTQLRQRCRSLESCNDRTLAYLDGKEMAKGWLGGSLSLKGRKFGIIAFLKRKTQPESLAPVQSSTARALELHMEKP